MTFKASAYRFCLLALLGIAGTVRIAEAADPSPWASSVTVTPAKPESGDKKKIEWEAAKTGKPAEAKAARGPVYIVKVYVLLPPPKAEAVRLYVGDEEIREYGPFRHGIFFKAYGKEEMTRWTGKTFKLGKSAESAVGIGKSFPSDALEISEAALANPSWKTTQEILAE